MRKCISAISVCILIGGSVALSDVPTSPSERFNRFRGKILNDYNSYRSKILDNYAKFLDGEWQEFESFWEEESPYENEKPHDIPTAPLTPEAPPAPEKSMLPAPKFSNESLGGGVQAAYPGGGLAEGSITDYDYSSRKIRSNQDGPAGAATSAATPGGNMAQGSITDYDYSSRKIRSNQDGPAGAATSAATPGGNMAQGSITDYDYSSRKIRSNQDGPAGAATSAATPGGNMAQGSITDYDYSSRKIHSNQDGPAGAATSAATPGGNMAQGSITDYDYSSRKINKGRLGAGMPATMASNPMGSGLAGNGTVGKSNYELAIMRLPDPGFAFGSFPGQIAAPAPGESGIVNIDMKDRTMKPKEMARAVEGSGYATPETFAVPDKKKNFLFDFYGMEAYIPEIDFEIAKTVSGPHETGAHWKKMDSQAGGMETARQLFGLAQQLGLNGYLTFRLAEAYADQRFPESNQKARMSAVHYLLANMGYDARLAEISGNKFTVMMPFDQNVVYGTRSSHANGRKYTILYPEGYKEPEGVSFSLATCPLPEAGGKTSDMRLTGLSLPMKAKEFTVTNGKLTLRGEVNENIKRLLHHYPQLPAGDVASSWVDQGLREDLVEQLRGQLQGMTPKEAVNAIMGLCHKGFEYATDQEYHGFEKPYFLEENFIYDFNDCEDRAIFMTYMVWNALGLPCQLVQYPGHESTAVVIGEDIPGYYYETDGERYYSADPTYIGSRVGDVMKYFRTTAPTVDKHYR